MKTIFLLYLALPQTRGSSYLYTFHLQPFFHSHEAQIDATLASLKARIYAFVQDKFRALWDQVTASVGQQANLAHTNGAMGVNASGAPPTLANPASGPVQLLSSFWGSYGPAIIASGTALVRQSSATATAEHRYLNSPPRTPPIRPSVTSEDSSKSVLERRRQLEAELAALSAVEPIVIPAGNPQASRVSSESELRERTVSSQKFEEVEVPSDTEGYELGGGRGSETDSNSERPAVTNRGSWFGWGGSTKDTSVRVKRD
jgi:receptor expression-enhancing protein 1/2/3/4